MNKYDEKLAKMDAETAKKYGEHLNAAMIGLPPQKEKEYEKEHNMSKFVKIYCYEDESFFMQNILRTEILINTDLITSIREVDIGRQEECYCIKILDSDRFTSSLFVDPENAQKIFDAIGVSL